MALAAVGKLGQHCVNQVSSRAPAPFPSACFSGRAHLIWASSRPHITSHRARAVEREVEGVDRDYCTDFECQSSPAVEQTVKSFARDVERGRHTLSLYQADVKYSDGFRSFVGPEKMLRSRWLQDSMGKDLRVAVKRLRMADKGTALVDWEASGTLGGSALTIPHQTTITMNLLTGRITSVRESMDLSKLPASAQVMVRANRTGWVAQQAAQDAQDSISSMAESLSSMDDSGQNTYRDPTDPTKFFQQNDNTFNDALMFTLVLAVLYALTKALAALEGA